MSLLAQAHEVRPSYLEIREHAAGGVEILWKQPTAGDRAMPMRPVLSSGWLAPEAASVTSGTAHLVSRWRIEAPHVALHGQRLTIEGLDRTMTDALVRISYANGVEATHLVKPAQPTMDLNAATHRTPARGYIQLGIVHIWTGLDHLLYVLGLFLLVSDRRLLVKTITAFTVAHSVTLGATALHIIAVPAALAEALIALSIVYLAIELVYLRRGRPGLGSRFPWMVALAFGLLHGLGFGGALVEMGLPPQNAVLALSFLHYLAVSCNVSEGRKMEHGGGTFR